MGIFVVITIAFVTGLLLSITNKALTNKKDIINEIEQKLPGYNCNSCGAGNCLEYARLLYDDITLDNCRFLKAEKKQEIFHYINSQKEEL